MIIKSHVDHRASLTSWVTYQIQKVAHNLTAPVVKPITTDLKTCFIVGCGHSGTTLLASRLGLADNIYLIPRETGALAPEHGLYTSRMIIQEWLAMTESLGREVLLEKTPKHIHSVDRIWKILPEAKVLVMVRNPLDNCASLYRRMGSLEQAIERWNIDNKRAAEIQSFDNVRLIRYEELVASPEPVFLRAANAIGAAWSDNILHRESSPYSVLQQSGEMALREKQVIKQVKQANTPTRSLLNRIEINLVMKRTNAVALRIGYE